MLNPSAMLTQYGLNKLKSRLLDKQIVKRVLLFGFLVSLKYDSIKVVIAMPRSIIHMYIDEYYP